MKSTSFLQSLPSFLKIKRTIFFAFVFWDTETFLQKDFRANVFAEKLKKAKKAKKNTPIRDRCIFKSVIKLLRC